MHLAGKEKGFGEGSPGRKERQAMKGGHQGEGSGCALKEGSGMGLGLRKVSLG